MCIRDSYGFRAPNGISSVVFRKENGDLSGRVFIADSGRHEIFALSLDGSVKEVFGRKLFVEPRGIVAFRDEKQKDTYHLYVSDQRSADKGAIFYLKIVPPKTYYRKVGTIKGEIESIAVARERNLVIVANESRRRLEYLNVSTGEIVGAVGEGIFLGEPEGLVLIQKDGPRIIALDQSAVGRILVFGPGPSSVTVYGTQPKLRQPDGLCLSSSYLFAVSEDRKIFQILLEALLRPKS